MSVIHAPRVARPEARHFIPIGILAVAFVILFLRLWYLQVVQAGALTERAEALHSSSVSKLAPRGMITDRNGVVLASVKPEIVITAKPGIVLKQPAILNKLAELLGVEPAKLLDKVRGSAFRPLLPAPIFVGAPIEIAARVAESADEFPGIGVETQPMRVYANTVDFSHILGYVWTPSSKDVERLDRLGLQPADYVGKVGVEYVYEQFLMGQPGSEAVETNAIGKTLRIVGRQHPRPGDRLTLTIDSVLQREAARLLKEADAPGAVVALDPNTGEVLCLASSPTYDTSVFEGGISVADWAKLRDDPSHPLTNRAIYGAYAPGSTFKVITSLAAEERGLFSTSRTAYCPGYYQIGNRKSRCEGTHGGIAFHRAFQNSCNTFFSDMGVRAGSDAICSAAISAGLGKKSGIDLLGEGKGLVPTDSWLRAVQKTPAGKEPTWYIGDTVNISIGQGDMLATPLQMANVAAMLANNGTIFRPHLLKSRLPYGLNTQSIPTQSEVISQVQAPDSFFASIKSAMVSVVEAGTARHGTLIPGVRWGGKTGSSQHKKGSKTHSWFIGIAPIERPQVVIAVLIEAAGHGGEVAAPMAAKIMSMWLNRGQRATASNAARSDSASAFFLDEPSSP